MKPDRPWWVEQRKFAIPTTLKDKIQGLPEEDQRFYCYIVSKVVVTSKKYPAMYHPISSKYFKHFIGSGYRHYINQLIEWEAGATI